MPPDVVPWKKIVPLPPLLAVILAVPQNVPPPAAVTAVGSGFTVIVIVLDVAVSGDTHTPPEDVIIAFTVLPFARELVEKKLPLPTNEPFTNQL